MGLHLRLDWFLLISLLFTVSESARLLGCYKEISKEARLMSGAHQDFRGTLTPDVCISFCNGKGFQYAGLQVSLECYCSIERPSFIHSANISDCNMKCDGDQSKMCGGTWRLSVYDIKDNAVNYVMPNYVGCFADNGCVERSLNGKMAPETLFNTPELCAGFCFRNGYRYAGVQAGDLCFCGEEPAGPRTSEGDCDYHCPKDWRFICGGKWRNSIYRTSIPDESEHGRLVGCFVDNVNSRLLSGFHQNMPDTNSPRKCMNVCKVFGYKYAGVEAVDECYCGNQRPGNDKAARENECLSTCPNGQRRCGGASRILVYSTFSVPH